MTTIKIFLDANIIFSLSYGSKGLIRLWKKLKRDKHLIVTSKYVLEEVRRNIDNPVHLKRFKRLIKDIVVVSEGDPEMICPVALPDKDKPVLIAAIVAKADYFLTGDITHFGKYFGQTIKGVKISSVRDFILEIGL